MKKGQIIYLALAFLMIVRSYSCCAKSLEVVQHLYKNAADALISIKKEVPTLQSKVYASLDHLDKMHATAKILIEDNHNLKKMLVDKEQEHAQLKKELATAKQELSVAKQSLTTAQNELFTTSKKLEDELIQTQQLSAQHSQLLDKVETLDTFDKEPEQIKQARSKAAPDPRLLAQVAARKIKATYGQSLRRNSTSEPSSPR